MKILSNGWFYPDSGAERLYDLRNDQGKLLAIGNRLEIWIARQRVSRNAVRVYLDRSAAVRA